LRNKKTLYWLKLYQHIIQSLSYLIQPNYFKSPGLTFYTTFRSSIVIQTLTPTKGLNIWKNETFSDTNLSRIIPTNPHHSNKLFLNYVTASNTVGDLSVSVHTFYQNLFVSTLGKHNYAYVNVNKLYSRWLNLHQFLYNLFFYQTKLVLFSTKTLKLEALSFNWVSFAPDYKLFKYARPFFFFKNNPYGGKTDYFYEKLTLLGLETAFITDVRSHLRTTAFLRKHSIYTIGLVSYNINPWALHYPIPVSSSSLVIQYFIHKLIILIRQQALNQYYNRLNNFWKII
jgi:hypothetical protein